MHNEWISKLTDSSLKLIHSALWQVRASGEGAGVRADGEADTSTGATVQGRPAPVGLVAALYLASVAVWRIASAALPMVERRAAELRREVAGDGVAVPVMSLRETFDRALSELRATLPREEWDELARELTTLGPAITDLPLDELETEARVYFGELLRRTLDTRDPTGALLALVGMFGRSADSGPGDQVEARHVALARALVSALSLEPLRHYASAEMLRRAAPADDDARARVTAAVETILR